MAKDLANEMTNVNIQSKISKAKHPSHGNMLIIMPQCIRCSQNEALYLNLNRPKLDDYIKRCILSKIERNKKITLYD